MNPAEFDDLLEKCFDGTATAAEQEQLVAAANASAAARATVMEAAALEAALRARHRDAEHFARAVTATVTRSGESAVFAAEVLRRIEPPSTGWIYDNTRDRSRRPLTRILKTRPVAARRLPTPGMRTPLPFPAAPGVPWSRLAVWTVAACLMAAAGVWLFNRRAVPTDRPHAQAPALALARVATVARDAVLCRAGNRIPLHVGMELTERDVVVVNDGQATLQCPDAVSEVALGAISKLELQTADGSPRFRLEEGQFTAAVARQQAGKSVVVNTPHAIMTVLGARLSVPGGPKSRRAGTPREALLAVGTTRFAMRVERERTRVESLDGEVLVRSLFSGRSIALSAGQSTVVYARTELSSTPVSPAVGPAPEPRGTDDAIVLYTFQEGAGRRIRDLSRVGTPLDLSIGHPELTKWLPGGGLAINGAAEIVSGPAAKVVDACVSSGAFSIELWVKSGKMICSKPEDHAHILLSRSPTARHDSNFAIECSDATAPWGAAFMLRFLTSTSEYPPGGEAGPVFLSRPNVLTDRILHFVATRDSAGTVHMFVDGRDAAGTTLLSKSLATGSALFSEGFSRAGGDFSVWQRDMPLIVGIRRDCVWNGELYLVAIYDRALSLEEANRHFEAGLPGRSVAPQASRR